MRYNLKIILSVIFLAQFSSELSLEAKPERHSTVSAVSDSRNSYQNNSGSRFNAMMPSPFTSRPLSLREQIEIAAYIQVQDSIYREKFNMGFYEFDHAMRLGYKDFIHKAFHDLKLSDQAMSELWETYLNSSWWKRPSKVEKYSKVVQEKIKKRNKLQKAKQKLQQEALDRKNQDIVMQQEDARKKETEQRLLTEQRTYEKQLAIEEQKRLAHALLEQEAKEQEEALIFYEQMIKNQYQSCNFDIANCPDSGLEEQWHDRQGALSKTTQQDFMQFDQAYHLTPQTVGFLAAHDVDYKDYQGFFGTDLQQQLHGEMCDVLSQAATLQANFPYPSNLQTSVVEFADAAYDANKNQQILLASQLMDVDWIVLRLSREIATAAIPYGKAIVSGAAHSATDFLHMAAHPIETCKGLGKAICFILETTALNCSEVVLEYPEIYEPRRDKRNAEISQALQSLGSQMANSTGPERVEAITRFGADFVVPGKIIHAIGGVCGAVRSQAKIMRTLEGVASVLGDELGFEEVSQELILATEQLEVVAQEYVVESLATEMQQVKDIAKKHIKSSERISHKQTNNAPKEVDTRCLLEKNLEIVQNAVKDAERIEKLPDGRIRYYEAETASSTPGPTRGSAYVTEYDPIRGVIRSWYESYDHAGRVNRVHPKMLNGKKIISLHYPHTRKELETIAQQMKGKK
jgi:hypothetical protein